MPPAARSAAGTSERTWLRHADADRVGEQDLVRSGARHALDVLDHARLRHGALERAAEGRAERHARAHPGGVRRRDHAPRARAAASASVVFWLRAQNVSESG